MDTISVLEHQLKKLEDKRKIFTGFQSDLNYLDFYIESLKNVISNLKKDVFFDDKPSYVNSTLGKLNFNNPSNKAEAISFMVIKWLPLINGFDEVMPKIEDKQMTNLINELTRRITVYL